MFGRVLLISGADAIIKAASFLLMPLFLAMMTKEEFGVFSYMFYAISLIPPVLTLSLYVPMIKNISANRDNFLLQKNIYSTSLYFILIVLFAVTALAMTPLGDELFIKSVETTRLTKVKQLLFLAMANLNTLNLLSYSLVLARGSAKDIVRFNLYRFIFVSAAAVAALAYFRADYGGSVSRMGGVVAGETLMLLLFFLWMGRRYLSPVFDVAYFRSALKVGLPLTIGAVINFFTLFCDQYILNKELSHTHLAEYNLALQFAMPLQMIMTALQTAWAPHIFSVESHREAWDQSRKLAKKLFAWMPLLILALTVLAWSLSLLELVREEYGVYIVLTPVLCLSVAGMAMSHLEKNLLVRTDASMDFILLSVAGAVVKIALCYVLILSLGLIGAAVGAAVSAFFLYALTWHRTRKRILSCQV